MTRCKHGMLHPDKTCGFCRGMIPSENQTKTYFGHEKAPGIGYRPTVSRQQSYVFEREIEVNEVTRKEEVMDLKEGAEMCPICHVNESPGVRVDNGEPKMCGECRRKAAAEGARKKAEREKQNIPDCSSTKVNLPPDDQVSTKPSPDIWIQAMVELQSMLREHVQKCRDIHQTMILLKDATGVEFEVKMPSLA